MTDPKYRYLEIDLLPLEWCLQSHLCYSEWRILLKIGEVIPTARPGEQSAGFLDTSSLGVPLLMSNLIPLFLNWCKQCTSTTPPPAHHSISPITNTMLQLLLLLLSRCSHVRLCATPETAAHQAPPSLGFSRQEHWSGLPFPSPVHESEKWKWSHSVMSDS